jgi:hypothetical protein
MLKTRVVRRLSLFLSLVAVGAGAGAGAARQKGAIQRPGADESQRPQGELEALAEQARILPPEFAADALIRIAQSDKLSVKRRRELLEEAFTLASNARYPLRLRGVPGSGVDTRTGYTSRGFDLEMDALSLRCRVVRAMLAVDKARAREMFRALPALRLPRVECGDGLVYEVSAFYETLAAVALNSFSPEEASRSEHVRFVEDYLGAMTSPVEVGPAAKAVLSLKLKAPQFEQLLHAFSSRLSKVSGDDRSFSYAVAQGAVANGIVALAEAGKKQGLPRTELLKATRDFLAAHLRASRCADNVEERQESLSDPHGLKYYNEAVAEIDPDGKTLSPLSADDIKPSNVEGAAAVHAHWETQGARNLLVGLKGLRFGSDGKPLTVNYRRNNSEWDSSLNRYLGDLSGWHGDDETTEEDYYHQKSVLYEGLLQLVPDGAKRDAVLASYASFLSKPIIQRDKPLDWFLHVRGLLDWARALPADGRARVSALLSATGDPILQMYAELERLAPDKGAARAESAPPPPSLEGNVTFRLRAFPYADVVALAGSFNEWKPSKTLFAQVDGEWVCRVRLPPGKYTYKFIVDGEWMVDPTNPLTEDDGSGNVNSVVVVGEDQK